MNCASAIQSARPSANRAMSSASRPTERAEAKNVRTCSLNPRVRSAASRAAGHATTPSSRSWASSSRTTTSCSGPDRRRTARPRSSGIEQLSDEREAEPVKGPRQRSRNRPLEASGDPGA